jgi:hypothetical protein
MDMDMDMDMDTDMDMDMGAAAERAVGAEPAPGVVAGREHAVSWEHDAHDPPSPPGHASEEAGLPPPPGAMASSGSMAASVGRTSPANGLSTKGLSASTKALSAKAHVQQVFPYMVHVSTKAHLSEATRGASATVAAARAAAALGRKRTNGGLHGESTPSPATGGPEGGSGGAPTAGTAGTAAAAARGGGAGCTPAIISARSAMAAGGAIYPNGVRDPLAGYPSSTGKGVGMGTGTFRVSPLTVSRGSPVLTVSPAGARAFFDGPPLRKTPSTLDKALNSLEAELRPSSKGVGAEIARDRNRYRDRDRDRPPAHRRLSGSPTGGPPSLEVRAAHAAAAAAKLMTGGKGGSGSAAEHEAEGEPAAPEELPSPHDLGLRASMLRWNASSHSPLQEPTRSAQGRPPLGPRGCRSGGCGGALAPAHSRRCPPPFDCLCSPLPAQVRRRAALSDRAAGPPFALTQTLPGGGSRPVALHAMPPAVSRVLPRRADAPAPPPSLYLLTAASEAVASRTV